MKIGLDIEEGELEDILVIQAPVGPVDTPERAFFRAILESAIHDLSIHNHKRQGRLADLARWWIEGAYAPVTFAEVCDQLGYEPQTVREALRKRYY